MARASMAGLIATVRRLIGDPVPTLPKTPTFSDDDIEAVLDNRRADYPIHTLTPRETVLPNGAVEYREYYADGGDWEANLTLQGSGYETLTPIESYPAIGRWVFDPAIQTGTVYIRGTRYDVNGAAADLLDQWIAVVAREFDFSRGSRSYSRSQKRSGMEALRNSLRSRQWLSTGEQVRTDMFY